MLLLALTLIDARFGIWPTPGDGTWQSLVFWLLFRTLNVAAIVLAVQLAPDMGGYGRFFA